jgi:MFS transporter, AAHS family, 4-hydroxybenzoate transporter
VRRIVARIAPELAVDKDAVFVLAEERLAGMPVRHLFAERRGLMTVCLWVPFFLAYTMLIFIVSWSPALLRLGGVSVTQSSIALAMANTGSLAGTVLAAPLIARFGPCQVLAVMFVVFSAAIAGLGLSAAASFGLASVFIVVSGMMGGATTSGLVALSGVSYPTAIRATGVGWALGIGRLGATAGPMVAGALLSAGWAPRGVCLALAAPGLIAAVSVLVLRREAERPARYMAENASVLPS